MIVTESKNRKIKICDQILEEIYSQIQKNDYDPEKGGIIVGRENLNNEKLTIDSIAKELGISRTSLYNKWTQLTGEALNKFILKIRMEKAHEMLKSGKYRVNEVPEKIGMKDMDNFREKYKKYFGKTPVDTIKNV